MEAIERAFRNIGSRIRIGLPEGSSVWRVNPETGEGEWIRSEPALTINIARDKRGEFFQVNAKDTVELKVLNIARKTGHLLLFARNERRGIYRFLCGLDERGWFAAAVTGPVSNVRDAMEALKPDTVRRAQRGLKAGKRNMRRNRAFLRQGEWYFVPEPGFEPDPRLVLRNEPIRRGQGSPHMVEEVYRTGGETVHVCSGVPNGLTGDEYRRLLLKTPRARRWGWRIMRRNMDVFGRGRVTHRDHRPLALTGWHRIVPNRETEAWFTETVLFID